MIRASPVPGRRQKMVAVDFGNPYYRHYFPLWLEAHRARLDDVRARLPGWAAAAARRERREARAAGREPRPLAVVFDIDEVLLCNLQPNGFRAPAGAQGPAPVDFHVADFFTDPATGRPWGRGNPLNPLLPGAAELTREVARRRIAMFLITGRLGSIRGETVANLERVGLAAPVRGAAPFYTPDLWRPRGVLTMFPDADAPLKASVRPYKEGRRREIGATHRIFLNVGDQVSDLGLYGDVQYLLPHPFYFIR